MATTVNPLLTDSVTLSASDFIGMAEAQSGKDNIIEAILPPQQVMIYCGDPFKGKSLEVQNLACQFAKGGTFHGLRCQKKPTLYMTWEGAPRGLANRFRRLLQGCTDEPIISYQNTPVPLDKPEGVADMKEYLLVQKMQHGIEVVIFDSFTYTVGGKATEDAVVYRWWNGVQELAKSLEMTFVFVWEFTKPLVFRGEEVNPYELSRLKTAYSTAYKVNTVIAIGELKKHVHNPSTGKTEWASLGSQLVVMKAKDCSKLPPLTVTLNPDNLTFNGQCWQMNNETLEYMAVNDG